jgi:hypothetical protein
MGVTTGQLSSTKKQIITINVPASLAREQADELGAALNAVLKEFNDKHPSGKPVLTVL